VTNLACLRGRVELQVLDILKGAWTGDRMWVEGYTEAYEGRHIIQERHGGPPYHWVRDGGTHGDCHAHDYQMHTQFLLFLKHGTPYWASMAATNEEVSGPDDPWVLWVTRFLQR
jgi:hypothetical protein